jgi:tetratricopeptide (TPR) repeat protein
MHLSMLKLHLFIQMRLAILLTLILTLAFSIAGQGVRQAVDLASYGVKVEADKRVIVVLAALEMAENNGEKLIKTPLSEKGSKFRAQLLQDNAALDVGLRGRISMFVTQYKKRHPQATDAELVEPFISMAFTLTPPPELLDPVITSDLPGNVLDVLDFAPLVRDFYRRSTIASKIDDYARSYNVEADKILRPSARAMVSELLDYLHTRPQLNAIEKRKVQTTRSNSKQKIEAVELRSHPRQFYIVPEMLAPQGNIDFIEARDDYYVMLPPDKDVRFSDVRRAFLQYVVDPIVLDNSKDATALRDWVKPQLDERRKSDPNVSPDVFLAISRSLAAAIDIRQGEYVKASIATYEARRKIDTVKTDPEKRAISADLEKFKQSLADESALRMYEDHQRGLVLTFFFADKLREIEESGFDIAASIKDMLATFDPAKENGRVAVTAEARKRALSAREENKKHPEAMIVTTENPITKGLIDIQKTIDAKDFAKASADLKQLLAKDVNDPRIHYNIGRVASLSAAKIEDPDAQSAKLMEAKDAYTEAIRLKKPDTDPALLSLTYVALARIYEHFNNNDYAIALYDQAIKLGPVGGYEDAKTGKERLLKP